MSLLLLILVVAVLVATSSGCQRRDGHRVPLVHAARGLRSRDRTRSHAIARAHTRSPEQVCIFDHFIYRRAVPSARSCAALLLITAGAVAYIACDREFRVKGVRAYLWASVLVG